MHMKNHALFPIQFFQIVKNVSCCFCIEQELFMSARKSSDNFIIL